jgi:hypothetical protein
MNKMKLYDFIKLSEVAQYNTVWSLGVHVDTHTKDNIAVNLYSINAFYCEVYYDMRTNKILYKESFKQGVRLDKYLNKFKI